MSVLELTPCILLLGYLETIRNTKPAHSRWKIVVVDAFTKQHLNHVLKVYDILEEGVQRECSRFDGRWKGSEQVGQQDQQCMSCKSIPLLNTASITI